ncbi:MAG: hypothetical protein ACT4QG_16410 [Sporichthyaceae bacterium]
MDRRLRAARDGGLVLALAAVAAVVVAQQSGDDPPPTRVTLLSTPTPDRVEFLVRGAGCAAPGDTEAPKRIRKRIHEPTLQYRSSEILVRFRVEEPGRADPCTGPDPGVPYVVELPVPVGTRTLVDANGDPPTPFAAETRP